MKEVLLVAPLPPPYGGIAHWTNMVVRHSQGTGRVPLRVINTALRHRSIFDESFVKRVLRGIPGLLRLLMQVLGELPNGNFLALHITTSGQYSLLRDVIILIGAKLFRRRSILHIRSGRLPTLLDSTGFRSSFLRLGLRVASHVIAIDEKTAQAIGKSLPAVEVSKVPNCIDMTVLPDIPEVKEQTVLFVGWVLPTKGIEELFEAWASMARSDWRLKIIGPCSNEYAADLARRHNLQGIEILGEYENRDVLDEMARAEILCLPSYTEGFPNVILEAMALRCAIVATPVGAIPELLADGAGDIVAARDQFALAEKLLMLMNDPISRRRMVDKANARVSKEYSIDRVYEKYEAIWKGERIE